MRRTILHHAFGGSLSFILGPCCDTFDKGAIFNELGDDSSMWDAAVVRFEFGRRAKAFTYTEIASP